MRNYSLDARVLALALVCLGGAFGRAQEPRTGTVTGHGTAESKRQPEYLRVQVEVLAKGKDLNEALRKLRERRQTSQKFLESLGAAPASIQFGEPAIAPEKNDRHRHMQMMMMRMNNPGQKPAQKPKEAPPIVVASTLKAEFSLSASNAEELLVAGHTLEQRMRAADLGGTKDLKQVTPQDEELAQEQSDEMMSFNDGEGPKPGEPVFLYVCKVSAEDRSSMLAQAFRKAKREATQLAMAAGAELGPLHNLEDNSSANSPYEENMFMEYQHNYRFIQQMLERTRSGSTGDDKQAREAIGFQPGKVTYRVLLSASFELKRPAAK